MKQFFVKLGALTIASVLVTVRVHAAVTNHLRSGIGFAADSSTESETAGFTSYIENAFDGLLTGCHTSSGSTTCLRHAFKNAYQTTVSGSYSQFDFTNSQEFSSFFFSIFEVWGTIEFGITVDSAACTSVSLTTQSSWVNCDGYETLEGTILRLDSTSDRLYFWELFVFSTFNVQHNVHYVSVSGGTLVSGSDENNAFVNTQMKVMTGTETTATALESAGTAADTCYLTALFPAQFTLDGAVFITIVDQDEATDDNMYSNNIRLKIYDFNSDGATLGTYLNTFLSQEYAAIDEAEFDLDTYVGTLIQGLEIGNEGEAKMAASSIGVLSNCLCSTTLTGSTNIIDEFFISTLLDTTQVTITKSGVAVSLNVNMATDSVSLICGNGDGTTWCQNRELTLSGLTIDNYPYITSFDSTTGELVLQASLSDTAGSSSYHVALRFVDNPSIDFPQTATLQIEILEECFAIVGTAADTLSMVVSSSATVPFSFAVTDSGGNTVTSACPFTVNDVSITNGLTTYSLDGDSVVITAGASDAGDYILQVTAQLDSDSSVFNYFYTAVTIVEYVTDSSDGETLSDLTYDVSSDGQQTWVFESPGTFDYALVSDDGTFDQIFTDSTSFAQCEGTCILFDSASQSITVKAEEDAEISLQLISYESGTTTVVGEQPLNLTAYGSVCVITEIATTDTVTFEYTIGQGPQVYSLDDFTQTPECGIDLSAEVTLEFEIDESYDETLFSVSQVNGTTQITVVCDIESLLGQTVEVKVNTTYGDLTFQNLAEIQFETYKYREETVAQNQAPKLRSGPWPVPIVPCLTSNEARRWSYQFDQAFDAENDEFSIEFHCPKMLEQVLIKSMKNNYLTLTLDVDSYLEVSSRINNCSLVLTDSFNMTANLTIRIETQCAGPPTASQIGNQWDVTPPLASIHKISNEGLVTVLFNKEMRNFTNITELIEPLNISDARRSQQFNDSLYKNAIRVQIQRSETNRFDPGYTEATVKLFFTRQIEIQLEFERPGSVSFSDADILRVEFLKPDLFFSTEGRPLSNDTWKLTKLLPRQMANDATTVGIEAWVQVIQLMMVACASYAIHPILKAILNNMLSMIEPLTHIAHYTLHQLAYPANIAHFNNQLFPLIIYDVIPDDYMSQIFNSEEVVDTPLYPEFQDLGYQGHLVITNIGSLFFIMLINAIALIYFGFASRYSLCCKKYTKKQYRQLKWNGTISLYYSSYFCLSMMGHIAVNNLVFSKSGAEAFSSCFAIALVVFSAAFPFVMILMLCKFKPIYKVDIQGCKTLTELKQINDGITIDNKFYTPKQFKQYLETYGGILQDFKLRKKGRSMMWVPFAKMITSLATVLVIVFWYDYPVFALFSINLLTLQETCFLLHMDPYAEKSKYYLQIFNDVTRLVLTYTLFVFTPFVDDPDASQKVGNFFIDLTIANMAVNFIAVLTPILSKAAKPLQKCQSKFKLLHKKRKMKALFKSNHYKIHLDKMKPRGPALKQLGDKELRLKTGLAIYKVLTNPNFVVNECLLSKKVTVNTRLNRASYKLGKSAYFDQKEKYPKLLKIENVNNFESQEDSISYHTEQLATNTVKKQDSFSYRTEQLVANTVENSKPWPFVRQVQPLMVYADDSQSSVERTWLEDTDRRMLNPNNWPRYSDGAFIPHLTNTAINEAEKQAYLNYLDSVLTVQEWDIYPKFKDPALTEECKRAYHTRQQEITVSGRSYTALVRSMTNFHIEELENHVADQIIKRGFLKRDRVAMVKLSKNIDKMLENM